MNILVIYGSKSCEHEISVITARQVIAALDSVHKVYGVYIDKEGDWRLKGGAAGCKTVKRRAVILQNSKSLYVRSAFGLKKLAEIDAAVLALHGVNGEDGTVQGVLKLAGIPFASCGVAASALTMDKLLTKRVLRGLDIPVLDAAEIKKGELKEFGEVDFPVVIKPACLGSSIGIGVARNADEFMERAAVAFEYDTRALYERALENFTDVNIAVYAYKGRLYISRAERPLTAHEILTFEDKYKTFSKAESKRIFPFEHKLIEKMRATAGEIYRGINASGIIRIDFLIDDGADTFYVNEINSIPGSLAHYLFPEITFPELIDRLIENAIDEQKAAEALTFVYKTDILDLKGKA